MMKSKFSILLITYLLSKSVLFANPLYEIKKSLEKSYKVGTNTSLFIDNKFGKVEIFPSTTNEFLIKVEIIANGRNEDRARKLLNTISVDFREGTSSVSCITNLGNAKSKNEEGFEINYEVYMPEGNPLAIENKFGDVTMGDRLGDLDLEVSYGSIKVGDVAGISDIQLSFGNGSMNKMVKGELEIKYSDFELDEAQDIIVYQGFSDLELGEIGEIELESKYGDVEIEAVNKIEADVQFSGFEIEVLLGSLILEASYVGDCVIEKLESSFSKVDIEGKFSSFKIGLPSDLKANIDAEFSFANLKYDSDIAIDFHYKVKESNKSYYRGKIGGGHPSKLIKIESGYGNLRLDSE